MKTSRRPIPGLASASGFTLIELMMVITIIAILASMGFVVGRTVIENGRKTDATVAAHNLKSAISTYYTDYRRMPVDSAKAGGNDIQVVTDEELLDVLLGIEDNKLNPRGTHYFAVYKIAKQGRNGLILNGKGSGRLVDAWGNEYRILLDTDHDGKLVLPFNSQNTYGVLPATVVVWSLGPDGEEGTEDDVTTW